MKKLVFLIPILLLAALALTGCSTSAEKLNNQGNDAFAEQDFENARLAYQQAQGESPEMAEPYYNEANTDYRQENYEGARHKIEQALVSEERVENLDQNSYYNLGNTFFQAQQYEAAIEVYKEALRLNPDDLQAKQNLELALRQLQQQQQEQQQQDQENQDQQDEQQQDEPNQDQENQDQQDQENQDQQNQDQENQDQQQDGQPDQQKQEGQPEEITGLTEEQARQLLEAAAENTESLEEFLQQILVVSGLPPVEDW